MYADPEGGLDHYEPAEDEHRYANDLLAEAGGEIMGRVMYDVMDVLGRLDVDDPATPEVEREFATPGARRRSTSSRAATPSCARTPRSSRATSSRPSGRLKAERRPADLCSAAAPTCSRP